MGGASHQTHFLIKARNFIMAWVKFALKLTISLCFNLVFNKHLSDDETVLTLILIIALNTDY